MEVVDIDDIRMRLAQPRVGIEMALEAYAWLKRSGDFAAFVALLHDGDRSGDFAAFVALLHDGDAHVARNAAWVLTKATDRELSQLLPALDELIDIALSTSNDSLRRLTLNLIVRLPLTKECLRTDFLDFCLDQMVRLSTPPGIQALCMKIANRFCSFYPELNNELMRTIAALDLSFYEPALKCTAKNIMQAPRRVKSD